MNEYTTKEQFNRWINSTIQYLVKQEKNLKQQIEEIKEERIKLHQKLECDHKCEVSYYSDYHSKIETYYCKECGFSREF